MEQLELRPGDDDLERQFHERVARLVDAGVGNYLQARCQAAVELGVDLSKIYPDN